TYFGTFKEWQEYLSLAEFLPDVLKDFKFSYAQGGRVSLSYKKAEIAYKEDLQAVTDDSEMKLFMSFFNENGKAVWDITGVEFWENKAKDNYYLVSREGRPDKGLNDTFFSFWKKLLGKEYPFNSIPYKYEGSTYIKTVHPKFAEIKADQTPEPDVVYTIIVGREGSVDDSVMKEKMEKACASAAIKE
ncbi:MAG: hypothetical protein ACRCUT_00110, partial [Spirochaetota bacterium]